MNDNVRTVTVNGIEIRVDIPKLKEQQLHLLDLQDLTNEGEDKDIFDTYSGVINFLDAFIDIVEKGKLL